MERVKLKTTRPRETKLENAAARVRLNKHEVDTDTSGAANEKVEKLISQKMKEKWLPDKKVPVISMNPRIPRKAMTGPKRKIAPDVYMADPFAYSNHRHPRMVYRLRLLGHNVNRIAEIFMVQPETIRAWRNNFPDFNQAWLEGGEEADAVVAQALFHRATGWQHTSEKVHITSEGAIIRAPIVERFAPDVGAIKFWLSNRQGGRNGAWTDRKDHVHSVQNAPPQLVVNPVTPAQIAPPPTLEAGSFVTIPDEDGSNSYEDDEGDV